MIEGLKTAEALQYAGLDRPFWNSVVQRAIRTDLPAVAPGRAGRVFDVDDLVALRVFADLLAIGVHLNVAGYVADDLRAQLRASDDIGRLHLVTVRQPDGTTLARVMAEPPADAVILWIIDVAKGRELVASVLANHNHLAECRAVIAETTRRVLCEQGMNLAAAWQVANRVHEYLESYPEAESLYVSGSPARVSHIPPENAAAALPLPVGKWRRAWVADLAELAAAAGTNGTDDAGTIH